MDHRSHAQFPKTPTKHPPPNKIIITTPHTSTLMKDLEFTLDPFLHINQNTPITGKITVSYPGRYDGIVINTQIQDTNHHVIYKSSNKKPISQNNARLFISQDTMPDHHAEFTAVINFETTSIHEVKFRASIIEQHKEIDSVIVFANYQYI